jgi:hypothetical protein
VIDDAAGPQPGGGWRALLPVSLLTVVACAQVTLATTAGLTPWKGGGFGMFSTTDDGGRRYVRVFVSGPERSEEITISSSLQDAARRQPRCPSTPSWRGWRAGSPNASAGVDVRWTWFASRPGASSTRRRPWRPLPV